MINFKMISETVFKILKGYGYSLTLYDENGKGPITNAKNAKYIYTDPDHLMFVFPRDLNERAELIIYKSPAVNEVKFKNLIKSVKKSVGIWLIGVTIRDFGKDIKPKDFAFMAQREKENVQESIYENKEYDKKVEDIVMTAMNGPDRIKRYEDMVNHVMNQMSDYGPVVRGIIMNKIDQAIINRRKNFTQQGQPVDQIQESMEGSSRSSYQKLPEAKIIVRHSKKVDEEIRGARSRNINSIFIENRYGERFKYPVNHLSGARALARHINEGGQFNDKMSNTIIEWSTELAHLKGFVERFEKDNNVAQIVDSVNNRINFIKENHKKIHGPRGYRKFMETYKPERITKKSIEENSNKFRGLFTAESEEDKSLIENVINYLAKIQVRENQENSEKYIMALAKILDVESPNEEIEQLADKLASNKLEFSPVKHKMRPQFNNLLAELSFKIADLADRVKDDTLSVILSRLSERVRERRLDPVEKDLIKTVIQAAAKPEAFSQMATAESVIEQLADDILGEVNDGFPYGRFEDAEEVTDLGDANPEDAKLYSVIINDDGNNILIKDQLNHDEAIELKREMEEKIAVNDPELEQYNLKKEYTSRSVDIEQNNAKIGESELKEIFADRVKEFPTDEECPACGSADIDLNSGRGKTFKCQECGAQFDELDESNDPSSKEPSDRDVVRAFEKAEELTSEGFRKYKSDDPRDQDTESNADLLSNVKGFVKNGLEDANLDYLSDKEIELLVRNEAQLNTKH